MEYQILVNKIDKKVEGELGNFGKVELTNNVGWGLGVGYKLTTQAPLTNEQIRNIMSKPEVDTVHRAEVIQI